MTVPSLPSTADMQGWLLDVYPHPQSGLVIWLLSDDGVRYLFRQVFPVSFFAAGEAKMLRGLWAMLQQSGLPIHLSRDKRQDVFTGMLDVLKISVLEPTELPRVARYATGAFPELTYYDVDIPVTLRYAAACQVFPLARIAVKIGHDGWAESVTALESPWDMQDKIPPLRVMQLVPDQDPGHAVPTRVSVQCGRAHYSLPCSPRRAFLVGIKAAFRRFDPDIVLTSFGDTWLFPLILDHENDGDFLFNPNRDEDMVVERRKERSIHTYGQVLYRGQQVFLFGRAHIDGRNAVLYGDYDLEGVLEQSRVTGLPVQEAARKSPGAGITALQTVRALQKGILVPYQKQQAENFKTAHQLILADRGGLVGQPLIGLHTNVAEIDFISMYPSIMVHFNISPETVGYGDGTMVIPQLGIPINQDQPGFVPETLRPLLSRRIAIKARLAELDRRDCRYLPLKQRSQALKWLLVVCFGYLGYKNARFGRIESHEAVTAYGRETLLLAKEAAEDQDYTVLHMYVDGLWVHRPGLAKPPDVLPLLEEITHRTGLPIALEGIYRWIAFLPSRGNAKVPVANRYFGVFQDGTIKMRGIEARRHDTPAWVRSVQLELLEMLAAIEDISTARGELPGIVHHLQRRLRALKEGRIPPEELLVTQRLSREVDGYKVPSPVGRAAAQLQTYGREVRPGQLIRFIYTRGEPRVWAWDAPTPFNPQTVDITRYRLLLVRAAHTVLQPFGVQEDDLDKWLSARREGSDQDALPLGQLPLVLPYSLPSGRTHYRIQSN